MLSFGNLKPPTGGVLEGADGPPLDELPETLLLASVRPLVVLPVSVLAPLELEVEVALSLAAVDAGLLTFCICASISPISKAASSASSSDVKNASSEADSSSCSRRLIEAIRCPLEVVTVAAEAMVEVVDGAERCGESGPKGAKETLRSRSVVAPLEVVLWVELELGSGGIGCEEIGR